MPLSNYFKTSHAALRLVSFCFLKMLVSNVFFASMDFLDKGTIIEKCRKPKSLNYTGVFNSSESGLVEGGMTLGLHVKRHFKLYQT